MEIGAADDADHLSAAHDEKSLDTMSFHQFDDRFQRIVLGKGEGIGRHDLIDLSAARAHVFGGHPSGSDQEFEPFRPLTLRADLAAA